MAEQQFVRLASASERAAGLPAAITSFLQLSFVSSLLCDLILPADFMLQHARAGGAGAHVLAVVILAAMLFPFALLPYWLGLAVIYARNEWAWRLLYVGAGGIVLALLVVIGTRGFFYLPGLCLAGAAGTWIAALVHLGKLQAKSWLHTTMPGILVLETGS